MIKIDESCAESIIHSALNGDLEEQIDEMFVLNPHIVQLIEAVYINTASDVLKNDPNITKESLEKIRYGIGLGVVNMYQLIRVQLESNDI